MAHWVSFALLAVAAIVATTESKAVPTEPMMLDPYGNPMVFVREKRTAVRPYPHRAMMFTSYYRPIRRSGGQATGVFAQGNAVSGEAFFGGMQAPHLKNGPEPIEEPEVSSAEAQASPEGEESYNDDDQTQVQQDEEHHPQDEHHHLHHHHHEEEPQDEQNHEEEEHHHKHHAPPQEEPEPVPAFTEAAPVTPEEPVYTSTEASRPKVHHGKKNKKTPAVVDEDEEDDDDDDEDDEPSVPFVPFKGNRRRQQHYPHLNNFFPMVFSFPGVSTRAGSSGGSPPGAVTAIANSYSTGKGGVASSVATAYGGSPNGKKRRTPTSEE